MTKLFVRISMFAALMVSIGHAETYYAQVPFNFVVGNKTAPAGEYKIDPSFVSGAILIKSADNSQVFLLMGLPVGAIDYTPVGKLVFHCYGDRYFLAEVWTRGSNAGRQLPRTPEERELATQRKDPKTRTTIAIR